LSISKNRVQCYGRKLISKNVMAKNVQHLNKHDICFKSIGCCCTVVY